MVVSLQDYYSHSGMGNMSTGDHLPLVETLGPGLFSMNTSSFPDTDDHEDEILFVLQINAEDPQQLAVRIIKMVNTIT